MKLLFLALAFAATFAHATGVHPTDPPTTGPIAGSYSGITADVRQRAEAQAAAASRAAAAARGGDARATGVNGDVGASASAPVTVNNLNGGDGNGYGRVVIHPSMIPPSPMAMNPQGNLAVVQTGCGPLIRTEREQVYATSPGLVSSSQEPNGYNVQIAGPRIGPMGEVILYDEQRQADGSTVLIGNQLIISSAITNQTAGANIAAGFIRSSGSGGQIGGGGSSAAQQLGERVIVVPCIAAIVPAQTMTLPPAPQVLFECREPAKPLLRRKKFTCPRG